MYVDPKIITQIDRASSRKEVHAILDQWETTHWNEWVKFEKQNQKDNAVRALKSNQLYLLNEDNTWSVTYFPKELYLAESRAYARLPILQTEIEQYDRTTNL